MGPRPTANSKAPGAAALDVVRRGPGRPNDSIFAVMGRCFAAAPLGSYRFSTYLCDVIQLRIKLVSRSQVDTMELSVVRIQKAITTGSQPWVQARSVVHPDRYLSQCPFILLNEEHYPPLSEFPVRSHDGVITMTLVLEGSMEQTDSTGKQWRLEQGDVDFSTGRDGVLRTETPDEQGVRFLSLRVNVPSSLKPCLAHRQLVRPDEGRRASFGDLSALLYAGSLGATPAPYSTPWPMTLADLSIPAGAQTSLPIASTERSFAYILEGAAELGRNKVPLRRGSVAWLERTTSPEDGSSLEIHALSDARMLFVSSPVIAERTSVAEFGGTECSPPSVTRMLALGAGRLRDRKPLRTGT